MSQRPQQQPQTREVYNDKALESRMKLRHYQVLIADGIKHPKASRYGRTILPVSNLTPVELSLEADPLPHTQLRTQNFQSINPSLIKPDQPPKVSLVQITADVLEVPVLRVNDLDDSAMVMVLLTFAAPFFEEKYTGNDCSNQAIYRAWCTLYGSIDKEFSAAVANTGMVMADMRVVLTEYQTVNDFIDAYKTLVPYMARHFIGMEDDSVDDRSSLYVIMCVLCQTVGKLVIAENYIKWYTNRARAASGLIGGCKLDNVVAAVPTMNGLQAGYTALSAVFGFRRMLVDRMFVYADAQSRLGKLFGLTLQMLASTELTHVYNIDLYIVKLVPEIMNLHMLRAYDDELVNMYRFWLQHRDIFPYVRFYIEPKHCQCINRNVLMPLIVASHAVATYMSDTFKNYRGAVVNSTLYKDITTEVGQYIQRRKDAGGLALGSSERAIATEVERDYVLSRMSTRDEASAAQQLVRDLQNALGTQP